MNNEKIKILNTNWIKKFFFVFLVFSVMGLLVGYVYGIHDAIDNKTIEKIIEFFPNPEKKPIELLYELTSLLLVVGIYSTFFKVFNKYSDENSQSFFWDEVWNLYRITLSGVGGFSVSILIIAIWNGKNIFGQTPQAIAQYHNIIGEYVWLVIMSFVLGCLPSLFINNENNENKTECNTDANTLIKNISFTNFILYKIRFFVLSIFS